MNRYLRAEYLPTAAVQARYDISDVTLWRWCRDPKLSFPKPLDVNRRSYFRRADLEIWEGTRNRQSAKPVGSTGGCHE